MIADAHPSRPALRPGHHRGWVFRAALVTLLAAAACGDDQPDAAPSTPAPGESADTPATAPAGAAARSDDAEALDAPATFRGLMPCASCPGILVSLEAEADGTGRVRYIYMEGEVDRDPVFTEEGQWELDERQRLHFRPEGTGAPTIFQLEDGNLVALDGSGEPLPPGLPRTLTRAPAGPMRDLAQSAWRFVEPAPAGGDAAVPSIRFAADGVVTGSDGCNAFRSSWSVDDDGGLRIEPLASTRMACPPGAGGVALRVGEVISAARSYRFEAEGSVLLLVDASDETIARLRPTP